MSSQPREPKLWFTVPAHRLRTRADAGYAAASLVVDERYSRSAYPLVRIGDLAEMVQYGTSARPEDSGDVRVIRMPNVQDAGLDLRRIKWVYLSLPERQRYLLQPGDLLFNRTNSKDLVGKTTVFREQGDWVFASYLIRVRFDASVALPEFVSAFLNSPAGRLQIDRDSRQIIGMANVNATELRDLVIPLPSVEQQRTLIEPVATARRSANAAIAKGATVDAELDSDLLRRLNIRVSDPEDILSFSVRGSALRGGRLDALAHVPAVLSDESESVRICRLGEIADINPKRSAPPEVDGRVPYVGLPECSLRQVREVVMREASDPIGRTVAMMGDILFARIEPSVFNRKYVLVEYLGANTKVFVSSEFYVVRGNPETVDQYYLYELLLSGVVAPQVAGKTTGSSGRRRLDRDLFAALAVPVPPLDRQREIATALRQRREGVAAAIRSADVDLQAALSRFNSELLPT